MIIKQNNKDGSAEILFSWKEIWTLICKKKLTFTPENFRTLTNHLVHICMQFNLNFNSDVKDKLTPEDQEIKIK